MNLIVAFAVVAQAVLEDGVSGVLGESDLIALAECDEYCSSRLLVVRQVAMGIRIFGRRSAWAWISTVEIKGKDKVKSNVTGKSKVKGVGQECPTDMGISDASFAVTLEVCL